MDFVDLWRCGRIRCLHLIRIASCKTYSLQWFRVLGASFSRFWVLRFRSWVLRFRVLGASFSSFGCFVFDLGCFVFEFWVLRFRVLGASFSSFGCFVFEFWVLRASVFAFECFVFETTRLRRRLQFLQNGDRLKLANFPDLYASRVSKIEGNTFSFRNNICLRQEPY